MALAVKPKQMKLLIGASGILGLALRTVLYAAGTDPKGLLVTGYWADTALWLLTAAVAAVVLLWSGRLADSKKNKKPLPASLFAAVGAALAGISFLLCPVAQTPSRAFGMAEPVLRFAAAGCLIWVSWCRFRGKTPPFLLHCAVCLYLALRLVCQYRLWSADPQIQNYAFYLGTHVALMITAYQLAAFDAGFGDIRNLWRAGLAAVYLATVSLARSDEPFFLLCCILWIVSNLYFPARKRPSAGTNQNTQEESQ